jgi:TIR domain
MTDPEPIAPSAFISYSHRDLRIARRLQRRLTAHGVKVWIDERELQLGVALPQAIRSHIQQASTVIVIASTASADSKWVGLELAFAQEKETPIIPLFVDDLSTHERFRDYLGLNVPSPQDFEEILFSLMQHLFRFGGHEAKPADPAILTAGLRDLATEEPDLAPLILGCLESGGLHQGNTGTVDRAPFHALDFAVNALLDAAPSEQVAYTAAYRFCHAGAGAWALFRWIKTTGDGGQPLVTAVGETLPGALIDTAIKLLAACGPPNNHALYQFISRNAAQATAEQRQSMVRLVTWPVRSDTVRMADTLGWVAVKHFPEVRELQQMWSQWIHNGSFDGKPSSQYDLAHFLARAHEEKLPGWAPVEEALRSHVRGLLRSGDKNKVTNAVDHLQAAADAKAPVLATLLREADGITGTAEWKDWIERDPEAAEWMGWWVHCVAEQARSDRDWLKALNGAQAMVDFEKMRQKILKSSDAPGAS